MCFGSTLGVAVLLGIKGGYKNYHLPLILRTDLSSSMSKLKSEFISQFDDFLSSSIEIAARETEEINRRKRIIIDRYLAKIAWNKKNIISMIGEKKYSRSEYLIEHPVLQIPEYITESVSLRRNRSTNLQSKFKLRKNHSREIAHRINIRPELLVERIFEANIYKKIVFKGLNLLILEVNRSVLSASLARDQTYKSLVKTMYFDELELKAIIHSTENGIQYLSMITGQDQTSQEKSHSSSLLGDEEQTRYDFYQLFPGLMEKQHETDLLEDVAYLFYVRNRDK